MSKKAKKNELVNLLVKALRHKIGSIVNENEIYAQKYSRDAEVLFKEAEKNVLSINWSDSDKIEINRKLKKDLKVELEKCDFLDKRKFDIIDSEIESALKKLNLAI